MMQQHSLSPQARREVRRDTPLRRARTCYGHLAGVAGVRLMDDLLARGWLTPAPSELPNGRIQYIPAVEGINALLSRGVAIPAPKGGKPIAFSCTDWTERRPHLGGALGRSIVESLAVAGYIERTPGSRAVALLDGFERWLSG